MELRQKHINAIEKAEKLIVDSDFRPYLELKELLSEPGSHARERFRLLFTKYYGLNAGGLTDEFKDRFFEILFSGNVFKNVRPRYESILSDLYPIKRRKKDQALQFSFVSKLVSIHNETCPIYDRHVLAFFEETPPSASNDKEARIIWYVNFLTSVRTNYEHWAEDKRIKHILKRMKARDPRLKKCDPVRLIDFLVWKVGNQKLLKK